MKALRILSLILVLIGIWLFIFGIIDHGTYWDIGQYSILLIVLAVVLWFINEPAKPPTPSSPKLSEAYGYRLIYDKRAKYWVMTVIDEPGCITVGESPDEALERMKTAITRYDCIEQE